MFRAGAVMGLLCGYLADRINQKWLTIVSLAVLGLVGFALFNIVTTPFWQGAFSFLEGTVQSGFFYVNNYSLIQRSVRSNLIGRASGLFVTCIYLPAAFAGYIFAAWLAGSVGTELRCCRCACCFSFRSLPCCSSILAKRAAR